MRKLVLLLILLATTAAGMMVVNRHPRPFVFGVSAADVPDNDGSVMEWYMTNDPSSDVSWYGVYGSPPGYTGIAYNAALGAGINAATNGLGGNIECTDVAGNRRGMYSDPVAFPNAAQGTFMAVLDRDQSDDIEVVMLWSPDGTEVGSQLAFLNTGTGRIRFRRGDTDGASYVYHEVADTPTDTGNGIVFITVTWSGFDCAYMTQKVWGAVQPPVACVTNGTPSTYGLSTTTGTVQYGVSLNAPSSGALDAQFYHAMWTTGTVWTAAEEMTNIVRVGNGIGLHSTYYTNRIDDYTNGGLLLGLTMNNLFQDFSTNQVAYTNSDPGTFATILDNSELAPNGSGYVDINAGGTEFYDYDPAFITDHGINATTGGVVAMWVYPTDSTLRTICALTASTGATDRVQLRRFGSGDNLLDWQRFTGGSQTVVGINTTPLTTNKWWCVVVMHDGTNLTAQINGTNQTIANSAANVWWGAADHPDVFRIGGYNEGAPSWWDGGIGEFIMETNRWNYVNASNYWNATKEEFGY